MTGRRALPLKTLLAIGLIVLLAPAEPARAQNETMQQPTVAVIDMQEIRQKSKAVKSIEQQIQKRKKAYQDKLSEKEKELREEDKSLAKQRSLLSEEAFKKKQKKLKERLGAFQRQIKTRRKALDRAYSKAMRRVQKQLVQIIRQIAEDQNLDVILNKGSVVVVRSDMEITELALERLNGRLASVEVPEVEN